MPVEFEGRVTVGEYRVASSQALLDVLEEMHEELDVDDEEEDEEEEEEEDEDEDEDEGTVIEAQLRHIWHLVTDGVTESLEKNLPLHFRLRRPSETASRSERGGRRPLQVAGRVRPMPSGAIPDPCQIGPHEDVGRDAARGRRRGARPCARGRG